MIVFQGSGIAKAERGFAYGAESRQPAPEAYVNDYFKKTLSLLNDGNFGAMLAAEFSRIGKFCKSQEERAALCSKLIEFGKENGKNLGETERKFVYNVMLSMIGDYIAEQAKLKQITVAALPKPYADYKSVVGEYDNNNMNCAQVWFCAAYDALKYYLDAEFNRRLGKPSKAKRGQPPITRPKRFDWENGMIKTMPMDDWKEWDSSAKAPYFNGEKFGYCYKSFDKSKKGMEEFEGYLEPGDLVQHMNTRTGNPHIAVYVGRDAEGKQRFVDFSPKAPKIPMRNMDEEEMLKKTSVITVYRVPNQKAEIGDAAFSSISPKAEMKSE